LKESCVHNQKELNNLPRAQKMKLKFTVTRLTALAGVFFFATLSATVECAKPLRMVQLFSEITGLYITAYWPDGALRVDSVAYSHASTFEVHLVDGRSDQWQLRALKNNLYVAAENGGGSICAADRSVARGWETFTVTELANNRVQLKTYQILYTAIVGVLCGWQAVWYVRRRIGARGAHPVELCYPLNRLKLLFLIRNHNNR
jgi:hypothetical protein